MKTKESVIDRVERAWLMKEPVTGAEVYYGRTATDYVLFLYNDNPLFDYLRSAPNRVTNLVLMGKYYVGDLIQQDDAIIKLSFENISIIDNGLSLDKGFIMFHNLWPRQITSLEACEEIEKFRKDLEKFRREQSGKGKKKSRN